MEAGKTGLGRERERGVGLQEPGRMESPSYLPGTEPRSSAGMVNEHPKCGSRTG